MNGTNYEVSHRGAFSTPHSHPSWAQIFASGSCFQVPLACVPPAINIYFPIKLNISGKRQFIIGKKYKLSAISPLDLLISIILDNCTFACVVYGIQGLRHKNNKQKFCYMLSSLYLLAVTVSRHYLAAKHQLSELTYNVDYATRKWSDLASMCCVTYVEHTSTLMPYPRQAITLHNSKETWLAYKLPVQRDY